MEIALRRIKHSSYDEIKKNVIDEFEKSHMIVLDENELDDNSEIITVGGKNIVCDYSIEKYENIANEDIPTYEKLAKIGMLLHKETKDINGLDIPTNVLYEPEVWAYLSFKLFRNVVKKLRLDDDDKMNSDKITRFYFNAKTRSRTGLLFVWSMIDVLGCEDNYEMSEVAFHFIDPVKAIYERNMAKNPIVLRAFVQAIIECNQNPKIKNKVFKSKIPSNISCFARINILDAYTYEDLVIAITEKMKSVLTITA